jgi:hydrogenase maturation protease
MSGAWDELARPAPETVKTARGELRPGSRVRLRPGPRGDILDIALAGQTAIVEAIEADLDGHVTLAVVVENDPGRDLGFARQPGHRFFFTADEVELLEAAPAPAPPRVLVAGVGNVFLGDDGFGVELAERMWRRALPRGVEVADFGIRGMDLAFAMQDGYDAVVLLDATPRGGRPGTVYLIAVDPDDDGAAVTVDAHGMDPVSVIALVRSLGGSPPRTYVVGCEPETRLRPDSDEIVAELSAPVRAAVDQAVEVLESLLADLAAHRPPTEVRP